MFGKYAICGSVLFGLAGCGGGEKDLHAPFELSIGAVIATDTSADTAVVSEGQSVIIDVLSNDNLIDIDSNSLYIYSPPDAGYTEVLTDGRVRYTHYRGASNNDQFTYSVADQNMNFSSPVVVSITVGASPDVASQDTENGTRLTAGGSLTINVVSNTGTYNPATMYIHSPPQYGYLVPDQPGRVTYVHYMGSGSVDRFSYVVADYDGSYTDPQWIEVSVGARATQEPVTVTPSDESPTEVIPATNDFPDNENSGWWQPRASDGLRWQLQLQGDIQLVDGVDVYAADVSASQASIEAAKNSGARVMCYISAGSAENWRQDFYDFPESVIGNQYENWPGEWWLDTRNIAAIAPVMRARMDACQSKGFDAIDADNVNGFENNTGFNLSRQDSVDFIRWLSNEAHERGMAFSLKNSESLIYSVIDTVDMLQSESCSLYGNCDSAAAMVESNKPVFAVEYQESISYSRFVNEVCPQASRLGLSMIYRDLQLQPYGVYERCD